ncbi:HAD domain-containing protein [Niveibacterium sp. 24ML]|uniref:HAD domain-containing protein n=1 Tax=Niveibacterium sp. 24ML TaxID=2985512 RepID=UPI002270FC75|nr:HAD domain-containing protein [Niveibacterium sp. 24ML]MCX9157772.1 HAD domain-containing protein [Niveibacterium sp. 24ML]
MAVLDSDGVLHPVNTLEKCSRTHLLDPVLEAFPDTEVVLSTNWREVFPFDLLLETLTPGVAARVVGTTPVFPRAALRDIHDRMGPLCEYECRSWLAEHRSAGAPWVALDDERSAFSEMAPVVWCDPTVGLTAGQIDGLVLALRRRDH